MATRRESVVLELDDRFTPGLVKAAAAAALFQRELDRLDGSTGKTSRSLTDAEGSVGKFDRTTRSAEPTIDKFSGRLGLLVQGLGAVGPAAVPIGAVAVPAVAALVTEFGFAAAGAVTMKLAFHGVGDALSALNKASLQPTAANIQAAQVALNKLGPDAGAFVVQLHNMVPLAERLQRAAGSGLFPGLSDSLRLFAEKAPLAERILRSIGTELGNLSREGAQSLTGKDWAPFFHMIEQDAPHALHEMAHAAGSVAHGLAQILLAFEPLNRDMVSGLNSMAASFDHWASGLSQTSGFQGFMHYLEQNGPIVVDTLGTIGDLFVSIVRDAAPLGGPTLQMLDDLLKVINAIAASPLGTPIITLVQALAVARLAMTGFGKVSEATFGAQGQSSLKQYGNGLRTNIALWRELNAVENSTGLLGAQIQQRANARASVLTTLGKGAAALGAIGVVSTGVTEKLGLTNTAMDAMAGAMVGGAPGAVAGGLLGATTDLLRANGGLASAVSSVDAAMRSSQPAFSTQEAALRKAASALDDYNTRLDYHGHNPIQLTKSGWTSLSDIFTHSGANAAADLAQREAQNTADKISAGEIGLGLGARENTTDLAQLQQVVTRVTPAMDRLGITWGDLNKAQSSNEGLWERMVGRIDKTTVAMDSNRGRSQAVADALRGLDSQMQATADKSKTLEDALNNLFAPKMNLNAAHNAWHEALQGLAQSLSDDTAKQSAKIAVDSAQAAYRAAVKAHGKDSQAAQLAAERLALAQKKLAAAMANSGHEILGNSATALKNQDVIRGLTSNLLDYLNAQAASGASSRQVMNTYRTQRQALIDTATQLGFNKKDLEAYLRIIGFTPKAISTQINLTGVDQAEASLAKLTRRRYAYVDVVTRQGKVDTVATGGHTLTGYAGGGTVPGSRHPYRDGVLALLAGTEEVISNRRGEADRFRRDRAMGLIPAYADGGMVSARNAYQQRYMSSSSAGWSEGIDYDRLARAMLNARPLYGPVHMQPHDYNQFRREMDQDRAMAGMSGVRHG